MRYFRKIIIISIFFILLLTLLYRQCNKRILYLYDYRLAHSDSYKIRESSDTFIIDEVLNNLIPSQAEASFRKQPGGFIFIEDHKKDIIEMYRIQGSYVVKLTYQGVIDDKHLKGSSFYRLGEPYNQLLINLCDNLRR